MARHIRLLFAAALATSTLPAHRAAAQTPAAKFVDSARVELDHAVLDMDGARIARTVVLLDRALVAFPDDPYLLHYRGYAAYWQAVGAFMGGRMPDAAPYIARGLSDLAKSAETLKWPETLQLEASLNGLKIALNPDLGPTLGPLAGRLQGEASAMGPNNPRVFLLQAYTAEGRPESMGGGAAAARALVAKAIAAFADDHPAPLAPAWGKELAESLQQRLAGGGGPAVR